MARDKALQEEARYQKERQETESINRIAELEDQMALDDVSTESTHPRNQKGLSFVFFCLTGLLIQISDQRELRGKRKTDVKKFPSWIVRTEEKKAQAAQHTNQKSAVSGPTLANQKQKRKEENVSSGNFKLITKWICIENRKLEDETEAMVVATRIPKKGDTGTKQANQKRKKVEENSSSGNFKWW